MKFNLKTENIIVGEKRTSPFVNEAGIYQDGTVPFCRDKQGMLWAMSGHSHMGHIGVFCGSSLADMKELYSAELNFCVGNADYAFSRIPYPEGVKARGSIWPFGLYICPATNRFFCFFHNETGWNGRGSAYDAFGLCETPRFDSDFRHIGLMHSDDEGRTWTFDRWVLTAEEVCFTDKFSPDAGVALGQKSGLISLGSGDFTFYDDPRGEYVYLFYNKLMLDMNEGTFNECDVYAARARKRTDGIMGDFVKYCNGGFCEAGNFGKESAIARNGWHARVIYSEKYGEYIMASSPINAGSKTAPVADILELRSSRNMLEWSKPVAVLKEGEKFGSHYHGLISEGGKGTAYAFDGDTFTLLLGHNGTDVEIYDIRLCADEKK